MSVLCQVTSCECAVPGSKLCVVLCQVASCECVVPGSKL